MKRPKRLLVASEPKSLGPKAKSVGAPGEAQDAGEPRRDVGGDFGVLEEIDDDAEEAEDTSGGDESAGVESAGAGFAFVFFLGGGVDERANQAAGKHRGGGARAEDRSRWRKPASARREFRRR